MFTVVYEVKQETFGKRIGRRANALAFFGGWLVRKRRIHPDAQIRCCKQKPSWAMDNDKEKLSKATAVKSKTTATVVSPDTKEKDWTYDDLVKEIILRMEFLMISTSIVNLHIRVKTI